MRLDTKPSSGNAPGAREAAIIQALTICPPISLRVHNAAPPNCGSKDRRYGGGDRGGGGRQSEEQKRAERALLEALLAEIGVPLAPRWIRLPSGNQLGVDGVSDDPPIFCEAWAHQGRPKAAQRAKVAKGRAEADVPASMAAAPPKLILLFSDEAACGPFRQGSWVSDVINAHHVEVKVVDLPPDLR